MSAVPAGRGGGGKKEKMVRWKRKTISEEMGEEQNRGARGGREVENSPIIEADTRARLENSSEEGREPEIEEKRL